MAYSYSPFRNNYKRKRTDTDCVFCDQKTMNSQTVRKSDDTLAENEHYRWIINFFPKFEGHTMVVPKKHVISIGSETKDQVMAREEMITLASETLLDLYPGAGIEVFLQTGAGSESSIKHLHWHVIPSQPSDPLRGFDKLGHFFTIEPDKPKILIFPVPIQKAKQPLLKALSKILKRKAESDESSSHGRRKRLPVKRSKKPVG